MGRSAKESRGSSRAKKPKKPLQTRGAGELKRSKSGGAVKGPIPKPGGTNFTDFEKGTGFTVEKQQEYAKRKK